MKNNTRIYLKSFLTILKAFKGVLNGVKRIEINGLSFQRFGYFNPKSEFSKSNLKNKRAINAKFR